MKDDFWVKGKLTDWKVFNYKGIIVSDVYKTQAYAIARGLECIKVTRGDLFVENSVGKVTRIYHPQEKDVLGFK